MRPKEVRLGREGRQAVLVVQCAGCGQETELQLPITGSYVCSKCGRTMRADSRILTGVMALEAAFRAKRPG
jgi:DNA-directed RNA polymerase subunit RPC12/RpoP